MGEDLAGAGLDRREPLSARRQACRRPSIQLGFGVVGYGCTTCVGNSGPLAPAIEEAIEDHSQSLHAQCSPAIAISKAASTRRSTRAFLMSPPLVVAYALAGTVNIDFEHEPLRQRAMASDVYLRDLWPSPAELDCGAWRSAADAGFYRAVYGEQLSRAIRHGTPSTA